jgi:hypothetical protein
VKRERVVRWGRGRRLAETEAPLVVEHWRAALGVRHAVRLERIDCQQVTDERGARGCSLVGVVYDAETACIYHTRALTPEDVVHELLHVAHPGWSEEAVVQETDRLLSLRQTGGSATSRQALVRLTPARQAEAAGQRPGPGHTVLPAA